MNENDLGDLILDCAIELHKELGPGLLETVYEVLLAHNLESKGLKVQRQVPMPIKHKGIIFEEGFRADLIVENKIIIELKSQDKILKVHKKQVITYLKLTGMKLGYLLNFGDSLMKNGIARLINGQIE
jgi:GxxExxY protein